jgi:hypothetical protein
MRHGRLAAGLAALLAAGTLYGCRMTPDIESQRDMGYVRTERSAEVMAEQSGRRPPAEDTTTAASVKERDAADALASGKQTAQASQPTR